MAVSFSFKEEKSPLFGIIRRPIAEVFFHHKVESLWQSIPMIIDTGADYTLLPRFFAASFGVKLSSDCKSIYTQGVGGMSKVYLLRNKIKVRIGTMQREIPLGFLDNDYIPPLLGRHEFFETFRVVFDKFRVTFE